MNIREKARGRWERMGKVQPRKKMCVCVCVCSLNNLGWKRLRRQSEIFHTLIHTHRCIEKETCPERYTQTWEDELCVCVYLAVCVHIVSGHGSVFMKWESNVEVMTESLLFTARDRQFITLMNLNECARMCVRAWEKKLKNEALSHCVIVKVWEISRLTMNGAVEKEMWWLLGASMCVRLFNSICVHLNQNAEPHKF